MSGMQGLKLKSQLGILALAVTLALVSGVFVSGVMTSSRTNTSSGYVKAVNVRVYWDFDCTQNVTAIDWGRLGGGDMVNKTVYVKNTGNSRLTLNMSSSSWIPVEAKNFMKLTWGMEGATVEAGGVVQAVLMLEVSESITGISNFLFRIVIEGKEQTPLA